MRFLRRLFGLSVPQAPIDVEPQLQWSRISFDFPHPPGADWITHKTWMNVAGLSHRKGAATRFVKSAKPNSGPSDLGLTLEREPRNAHDSWAIKVMGWTRTMLPTHLGYVPAHRLEEIAIYPPDMLLGANLKKVGISDRGDVFIEFALLIPSAKERKANGWNPS